MGILKTAPPPPPASLKDRIKRLCGDIEKLHAELDTLIDDHVAEEAKAAGGFVPRERIRSDLLNRVSWCRCSCIEYLDKLP
jgi:hypothetical protein